MTRWGMVIDLRKCVGCQTCTVSCKIENFLPPDVKWGRVEDYEEGEYPDVTRRFLPMLCMHCEKPACKEVCPTGATYQRDDGIVVVNYDICIGCKYCMTACPYEARSYMEGWESKIKELRPRPIPKEAQSKYQQFVSGTVTKCTFCAHRIDKADGTNKEPGEDPKVTPTCVNTCTGNARYFGDLDNPNSKISQLAKSDRAFRLHEEIDTSPSVYYLR